MSLQTTTQDLATIVNDYVAVFGRIDENELKAKPAPSKWSKKEVLGHLIDSAHNNYRRFIAGQYESHPKIFYEQNFWVACNAYQEMNTTDLIALWRIMNERICVVLKEMNAGNEKSFVDTGKENESLHSIEWLAQDYVKHLKHHINQIQPKSFDIVYP
jgi:hypothetical protein